MVLRRLRRFEAAARLITGGEVDRRLPETGNDSLSWIAREFNKLADTVTGLLTDVRREREQLEMVINGVDDGIVVLDKQLDVVAANDAFVRRAGRPRDEVVGHHCATAAADFCAAEDCLARTYFEGSEQRQVTILAGKGSDGRTRHEEVRASPIADVNGGVRYVVEVWRDVTERRAAEAKMAESDRLASLGMLASGFSHELNTPLATVLTCVEGILRAAESDPIERDYIAENARISREQLLRCRGVTQQFLRLARGDRAEGGLVDLEVLVPAIVPLVAPTATSICPVGGSK